MDAAAEVDVAAAEADAAAEVVAAVAAVTDGDTNNSPGNLLLLRYFVTRQGFVFIAGKAGYTLLLQVLRKTQVAPRHGFVVGRDGKICQ